MVSCAARMLIRSDSRPLSSVMTRGRDGSAMYTSWSAPGTYFRLTHQHPEAPRRAQRRLQPGTLHADANSSTISFSEISVVAQAFLTTISAPLRRVTLTHARHLGPIAHQLPARRQATRFRSAVSPSISGARLPCLADSRCASVRCVKFFALPNRANFSVPDRTVVHLVGTRAGCVARTSSSTSSSTCLRMA